MTEEMKDTGHAKDSKMQMEMRRGRQWQEIWTHLENWKHKLKPARGTWDRRRMESVSKCVITTASLRFLLVESADSLADSCRFE